MDKIHSYIVIHTEKQLNHTIFDTKWIPNTAKSVALGSKPNGNGILEIFELESGSLNQIRDFEQKSAFKCGSFGATPTSGNHLAVVTFDGNLQVLDIERLDTSPLYSASAHKGIVNCMDAIGGGNMINCGAPEIVTGGADGFVKVWDLRQPTTPVACISSSLSSSAKTNELCASSSRECWSVAFGDSYDNEERSVCAGYDNGDVKMFDLRKMRVRWETNVKNGICGIEFDRKDIRMNKVAVTTLEGGLHVYDVRALHSSKGFASVSEKDAGRSLGHNGIIEGARATVWNVKHLPQNRDVFVTCGGTGSIRLWQYLYPPKRMIESADGQKQGVAGTLQMLHAVSVSSQPINSFDWNSDCIGLAVCGSFDQTVRILVTTNLNLY